MDIVECQLYIDSIWLHLTALTCRSSIRQSRKVLSTDTGRCPGLGKEMTNTLMERKERGKQRKPLWSTLMVDLCTVFEHRWSLVLQCLTLSYIVLQISRYVYGVITSTLLLGRRLTGPHWCLSLLLGWQALEVQIVKKAREEWLVN